MYRCSFYTSTNQRRFVRNDITARCTGETTCRFFSISCMYIILYLRYESKIWVQPPQNSSKVVHLVFFHTFWWFCSWFLRHPKFETPKVNITCFIDPKKPRGPILTWHVFALVARDLDWWPWSWHHSSLGCNETNRTETVGRPWRCGRGKKRPVEVSKVGMKQVQRNGWIVV